MIGEGPDEAHGRKPDRISEGAGRRAAGRSPGGASSPGECCGLLDLAGGEPAEGSYFVAAYPPFACWTEAGVAAYRERLERPAGEAPPPPPLILYAHVPFCVDRCSYCYYLAYDDRGGEVGRYLEALEREAELYAAAPGLAGRALDVVYFGGGTPSLLSVARIRRLLGRLRELYDWSRVREATFECAPRSVTGAKLAALRELGITRLSLGVQQLDDAVLERNGRVHRVADVERAMSMVRETGFPTVNVDLIAGLVGESDRSFAESLERVIELAPDSVTVYLLEIPRNTPLYSELCDGRTEPPGWETKRRRLAEGFERLERAGYAVRSAYAAVRDPARQPFLYQDEQYRGADLLGLGVASFSYLGGVHQQNRAGLESYLRELGAGRLPLGRAYALDAEARMVREVVLGLKLGSVDAAALAAEYGVDPRERLSRPLRELADRGLLTIEGATIELTRDGLLHADRLVRDLFLPEHRPARYG